MAEIFADLLNFLLELCFSAAGVIGQDTIVTFAGAQSNYAQIWTAATAVSNTIIEPIAVFIVMIYFMLAIMEKASSEHLSLETMFKEVIKLCLGLYLVSNAVEIVVNLINLGNGVLQRVLGFMAVHSMPTDGIFTEAMFSNWNVIGNLLVVVVMVIILLIQLILIVLMRCVVIVRLLEIAIRASMAPIALSDTFTGNLLNSHAVNFMRSFGGLCLQGVFIAIIADFMPLFWSGLLGNPGVDMWGIIAASLEMIVVLVAAVILMFKSGSIAKEMMGGR